MIMNNFFAMLSRMKNISRWALMRNTQRENLSEHSLETAIIAHALAEIGRSRTGSDVSPERVALLAMFHDAPEILTGDLPTPAKYHSHELREAYKKLEHTAGERLLSMLPEDIRGRYQPLLIPSAEDAQAWRLVKAADKLSALVKCIEERKAGNQEFLAAERSTMESLKKMALPEVELFIAEFLPAYSMTLDELNEK